MMEAENGSVAFVMACFLRDGDEAGDPLSAPGSQDAGSVELDHRVEIPQRA